MMKCHVVSWKGSIVFCKRKWEEDREAVIKGLRRLADYPEYVWVSEG